MSERDDAARYERMYPGALSDEAQKAERMDRIDSQERRQGDRVRRYVSVPELPWHRKDRT